MALKRSKKVIFLYSSFWGFLFNRNLRKVHYNGRKYKNRNPREMFNKNYRHQRKETLEKGKKEEKKDFFSYSHNKQ